MAAVSIDFGLSGFANCAFEDEAVRLIQLACERRAVELRAWGLHGEYKNAKPSLIADHERAFAILGVEPAAMERLGCVFSVGILAELTNIVVTIHRRPGWTLVEGDLFLDPLMRLDSPTEGIGMLVAELAFIASQLDISVLNVVDEESSVAVHGGEVREPALVSIVASSLIGNDASPEPCHGRSVVWVRTPREVVAGEPASVAALEQCRQLWDRHALGAPLGEY